MENNNFDIQEEYLKRIKKIMPQSFMLGHSNVQNNGLMSHSSMNGEYSEEDLAEWFQDPTKYKDEIIDASRYLYFSNALYDLIINYHANLLNLDYVLAPDFTMTMLDGSLLNDIKNNTESIFKSREKARDYAKGIMSKPNIRKIIKTVLKEGSYFGYEIQDSNKKYFFQDLDREYCKVFAFADGMPTFKFNFKYFDDKGEEFLEFYPKEFKLLYNQYKNDKEEWKELDPQTSICILMDESDHSLPAFSGMFSNLLNTNTFYDYLRRNTDFETLRILLQTGLIDEKTGDPLTSPDLLAWYNNALQQAFGDSVKVASSIFDIKPIDFSNGNKDNDLGVDLIRNKTFEDSGISKAITGESDNSTSIKFNDANSTKFVLSIVEKIEKWINSRLFKLASPKKYPWKINILPTTLNNSNEIYKSFKEMFTYGGSLRYALSSLGVDSDDYINLLHIEYLEGLIEMLTPPKSSHTTSGNESGRPLLDDDELGDSGEQTRDIDGNER